MVRSLVLALCCASSACDLVASLPRDPDHTLDRVHAEHVLRVGYVDAPPYASAQGGVEMNLVAAFAQAHGADVSWRAGTEGELLRALEEGALDVVVAGLDAQSPWRDHVAFTRPWVRTGETKRALAARPGENELLVALERHLAAHGPAAARLVGGEPS